MADKKEMIEQIIQKANLKEKVDAAFSEIEDQAKEKLMAELENALREKLQKELEKKADQIKQKAKKRVRKTIITAAVLFCSGLVILNLDKILPSAKKKANKISLLK